VAADAVAFGAGLLFVAGAFLLALGVIRRSWVLVWQCAVGGHDPWKDNTFRFGLATLDAGRTRLRFWQEYAVELDDDSYGTYNFVWGFYLESLHQLCENGTGHPHQASVSPGSDSASA
jgi:hypothetical protein